jgi:hypothetical protein
MQMTGGIPGTLVSPTGPIRNSKLRVVSNLLLLAGALIVALLMLVTLVVRQKAVSEAEKSEASLLGAEITIYQAEGDPEWHAAISQGPTGGFPPDSFTCEFDDGTIVRIRGDKVETFLSHGYWHDLLSGVRLFVLIIGVVAISFGVVPKIRGRRREQVNLESPLGLSAEESSSASHGLDPES